MVSMLTPGTGLGVEVTSDEIVDLVSTVTEGAEFQEVPPIRSGVETRARGVGATEAGRYAVTMTLLEHQPAGRYQRSRVAQRIARRGLDPRAEVTILDLQDRDKSLQIIARTHDLLVYRGDPDDRPPLRHELTQDDCDLINGVMLRWSNL